MSHNRDGSSYKDAVYDSDESAGQGRARHEVYIPQPVQNPTLNTPIVSGQPPVLISNTDLMQQLYHMRDAMNSFESRLGTVERESARRYHHHPRHHHRPGKSPVGNTDTRGRQEVRDGGRPLITPLRLEYSEGTIPIVEHPDDEVEEPRRLDAGNQVTPHPHMSSRIAEEVWREKKCSG